jgi:hypothetical protein
VHAERQTHNAASIAMILSCRAPRALVLAVARGRGLDAGPGSGNGQVRLRSFG